jgi:hypothetical protein
VTYRWHPSPIDLCPQSPSYGYGSHLGVLLPLSGKCHNEEARIGAQMLGAGFMNPNRFCAEGPLENAPVPTGRCTSRPDCRCEFCTVTRFQPTERTPWRWISSPNWSPMELLEKRKRLRGEAADSLRHADYRPFLAGEMFCFFFPTFPRSRTNERPRFSSELKSSDSVAM